MALLSGTGLLACDGCFYGIPAIISLFLIVVALIGSIYMLLWSNFGARLGYLVLMVSLFGFMILMSALWLFGAPGTTTSTGPRGPEPAWVPFTPDSAAAGDYTTQVSSFPKGWDIVTPAGKIYDGKIDAKGEIETVRTAIREAEARLAAVQKTDAVKAADWNFRPSELPAVTPDEKDPKLYPPSTVAYQQVGKTLLFGVRIPATAKHPETLVFAYRDKGRVYLHGLISLIASLLGFASHLWLLARFERAQRAREAALSSQEPKQMATV